MHNYHYIAIMSPLCTYWPLPRHPEDKQQQFAGRVMPAEVSPLHAPTTVTGPYFDHLPHVRD